MPRFKDQAMNETDRLRVALGIAKVRTLRDPWTIEYHQEVAMLQDAYGWHLARDFVAKELAKDPELYFEVAEFTGSDIVIIRTDQGKQRDMARTALAKINMPEGILVALEHV